MNPLKLNSSLLPVLQQEIERHALPEEFIDTIQHSYLPVANRIAEHWYLRSKCLLTSFNGSQGSGKSTITAFLKLILSYQFGLNTVELSIDDFYLTHQQRRQLADDIHPLFATRGVPGTHDIQLAETTLSCLRHCSQQHNCSLPRFDKATDDRKPESDWPVVSQPVDIILFEGWCNHAPVQSEQQLIDPINDLERQEDADAHWRTYANEQLKQYHEKLFDQFDLLVFLQIPGFDKVYEWRGLQEQKLARSATGDSHAVMDDKQLRRFIQHYERITRSCLEQLPERADIVMQLDADHAIQTVSFRNHGQIHA